MSLVVPAVLPSSRNDLEEKLGRFMHITDVTRIQIDVVDGRFASPACWPYTEPGALEDAAEEMTLLPHQDRISYEIDLMCTDADRAAGYWLTLGASRLTFHAESVGDLTHFLARVGQTYGRDVISFGVALNLSSDFSLIQPVLEEITYVQFMGIEIIGKQAQTFDPRVVEKVRSFHAQHPQIPIQVDGGVSFATASALVDAGVTNLIVGSALLHARNLEEEFEKIESLQSSYAV